MRIILWLKMRDQLYPVARKINIMRSISFSRGKIVLPLIRKAGQLDQMLTAIYHYNPVIRTSWGDRIPKLWHLRQTLESQTGPHASRIEIAVDCKFVKDDCDCMPVAETWYEILPLPSVWYRITFKSSTIAKRNSISLFWKDIWMFHYAFLTICILSQL